MDCLDLGSKKESRPAIVKLHLTYPCTEVKGASFHDLGRNFYHNWHR